MNYAYWFANIPGLSNCAKISIHEKVGNAQDIYFLSEKQILYKLIQVFFCFSCYNYFIIHIFLSYLKSHHPHFGNFPFLKILWIVPVFETSLLLS